MKQHLWNHRNHKMILSDRHEACSHNTLNLDVWRSQHTFSLASVKLSRTAWNHTIASRAVIFFVYRHPLVGYEAMSRAGRRSKLVVSQQTYNTRRTCSWLPRFRRRLPWDAHVAPISRIKEESKHQTESPEQLQDASLIELVWLLGQVSTAVFPCAQPSGVCSS